MNKENHNLADIPEYREVIHELRNSLSIIFMQAQLLVNETETDDFEVDKIKKSAKAVEHSVQEMVTLLASK